MSNYEVTIIRKEVYRVEAEDTEAAIEFAAELCEEDAYAFSEPQNEYIVMEV